MGRGAVGFVEFPPTYQTLGRFPLDPFLCLGDEDECGTVVEGRRNLQPVDVVESLREVSGRAVTVGQVAYDLMILIGVEQTIEHQDFGHVA